MPSNAKEGLAYFLQFIFSKDNLCYFSGTSSITLKIGHETNRTINNIILRKSQSALFYDVPLPNFSKTPQLRMKRGGHKTVLKLKFCISSLLTQFDLLASYEEFSVLDSPLFHTAKNRIATHDHFSLGKSHSEAVFNRHFNTDQSKNRRAPNPHEGPYWNSVTWIPIDHKTYCVTKGTQRRTEKL